VIDGDRRTSAVLVFDGDCALCSSSVRFLRRWVDRRRRYQVLPWQHLDLASVGLTAAQCDEAVWFVEADGTKRRGHRAVAAALRSSAPAWRPLGVVLVLPGISWLAGRAYAWVSSNRSRLPGGTPACAVPPKPQQPRSAE
jgi:predicted DCC family thiol-disulfide oxidoreductase YuxK